MRYIPRPRPPFPDPPFGLCDKLVAQLSYAQAETAYAADVVNRRTGNGFVINRVPVLLEELSYVLGQYAYNWNGKVPLFIPIMCRGTYAALYTLRRHAYRMLDVVSGSADLYYADGTVVSDGFIRNRPHNKLVYIRQYLQDINYF